MKFGLYVHIPYCLQKCTYCDFVTTPWTTLREAESYMALLQQELQWASRHFPTTGLSTVYFGGGTPSLIPPSALVLFLEDLKKVGVPLHLLNEITLEINPGTVSQADLDELRAGGFTRFSVGTQTFQEHLLKPLGREHTVEASMKTLSLLKENGVDFTMDVLYGLPRQGLSDLGRDLEVVKAFDPPHVSTYNLTVPEGHFLNRGRLSDEGQVEMYQLIVEELATLKLKPYEISNFARPGSESVHNRIYWQDEAYWALGASGHSYLPLRGPWGTRFWNPPNLPSYARWVNQLAGCSFEQAFEVSRREDLNKDQSFIDFVHTSLRQTEGFLLQALLDKFGEEPLARLQPLASDLVKDGLLQRTEDGARLRLSPDGRLLLNSVLRHLLT